MIPIRLEELRRAERELDLYADELDRTTKQIPAHRELARALRTASKSVRAAINLWPANWPSVIDRHSAKPIPSQTTNH